MEPILDSYREFLTCVPKDMPPEQFTWMHLSFYAGALAMYRMGTEESLESATTVKIMDACTEELKAFMKDANDRGVGKFRPSVSELH